MTLRQYISVMILGTIFCWSAWMVIILNVDPFVASTSSFIFFYFSLFLALLGTTSLVIFAGFRLFGRDRFALYRYVQKSFVNAMIISVLVIGIMYLQSLGYLHYWNLGILLTLFIFLGLFKIILF